MPEPKTPKIGDVIAEDCYERMRMWDGERWTPLSWGSSAEDERDLIVADLRRMAADARARTLIAGSALTIAWAEALEYAADRYERGDHRKGGDDGTHSRKYEP